MIGASCVTNREGTRMDASMPVGHGFELHGYQQNLCDRTASRKLLARRAVGMIGCPVLNYLTDEPIQLELVQSHGRVAIAAYCF